MWSMGPRTVDGSFKLRVVDFRELVKGDSLRGFVAFEDVQNSGLVLHDCTYHARADGVRWVGMPARDYIAAGEKKWFRLVDFNSCEAHQCFQTAALAALNEWLRTRGQK
jgi:hypothetical protein